MGLELDKDTPPEMIPILTLLAAQKERVYFEGYYMLLNDLNKGEYIGGEGDLMPYTDYTEEDFQSGGD